MLLNSDFGLFIAGRLKDQQRSLICQAKGTRGLQA